MRVVAAEAGDDDLALVGLAVAVGVLQEEDVGRVGDPDAAVADGDARGDVQPVGEDRELVALPSPSVSSRTLTRSRPGPGDAAGIFQALGDPDPAALVEGHRDRVDDVGLAGDELDREAWRDGHRPRGFVRGAGGVRRPVLVVRDLRLGDGGRYRERRGGEERAD